MIKQVNLPPSFNFSRLDKKVPGLREWEPPTNCNVYKDGKLVRIEKPYEMTGKDRERMGR